MGRHKNEILVKAGVTSARKEVDDAFPIYRAGLRHFLEKLERDDVVALETSEDEGGFSFSIFSRDGRRLPRYERLAVEAFTYGWWWSRKFPIEIKSTLT